MEIKRRRDKVRCVVLNFFSEYLQTNETPQCKYNQKRAQKKSPVDKLHFSSNIDLILKM